MQVSPWFVLILGMGTVFTGLVCLVFLTKLMSSALKPKGSGAAAATPAPAAAAVPAAAAPAAQDNRQEIVAAISAALALGMGNEPKNLRIHNIKRV